MQSQALTPRLPPKGAVQVVPRQAQAGLAAPKETWNQAVAPEAVFDGISNTTCAAVKGGPVTFPSDMGLALGDTPGGVIPGVNNCLSVFDNTRIQQAGLPHDTTTFFA